MEKKGIEELLIQKSRDIELVESKEPRAQELLKILELEYQSNKNIDLLSSAQTGLIEMMNEMNKLEMSPEIEYSINLIQYFLKTGKFDLITITNKSLSSELAEKYERLRTILISIINKLSLIHI